jgi:hypothetical protein
MSAIKKTVGMIVKKKESIDDDIVFYNVYCTELEAENGEHFSLAENLAKKDGLKVIYSFDEDSDLWNKIKQPPIFVDAFVLFEGEEGIDCLRYVVECQKEDEIDIIRFVMEDFEECYSPNREGVNHDCITVFKKDNPLVDKLMVEDLGIKKIKYKK